jgi:alkaline phosphatase
MSPNPIQLIVLVLSLCMACNTPLPVATPLALPQLKVRPKNVIFMVGDGMGLTQVTAGLYTNGDSVFHMSTFPVTGLITTHSGKELITDSAAGATAFACGCKTYNGAIGVDMKKQPCRTLFEQADSAGMGLGIVVSCSVTHATPACFVAHVDQRKSTQAIAPFFLQTQVDYLVGGGLKNFNQRTDDTRNLWQEMTTAGYQMSSFSTHSLPPQPANIQQPYAWFSSDAEPVSVLNGRNYLPFATAQGLSFLQQRSADKGFMMLVEGSQIDWAGHDNDGPRLIAEVHDFDRTIGKVLEFARRQGNTLVVVTADHETGGAAIVQGSTRDSLEIKFTTKSHTATMVPVFAFGPGSECFHGVYDNTDLHRRLKYVLGF